MWRKIDFTKTQMKLLEMEYKIAKIRISLNSVNSTIDTSEEKYQGT